MEAMETGIHTSFTHRFTHLQRTDRRTYLRRMERYHQGLQRQISSGYLRDRFQDAQAPTGLSQAHPLQALPHLFPNRYRSGAMEMESNVPDPETQGLELQHQHHQTYPPVGMRPQA